jgi:EAL domain-containing protein (putative c-di-GMP-specific phosphodiesterase class I)
VAEGVETEAQARMLRELGCHELQGYLYSRPVEPTQFLHLPGLRRGPPNA